MWIPTWGIFVARCEFPKSRVMLGYTDVIGIPKSDMVRMWILNPTGSMYGNIYIIIYIYTNIGGIVMVNVTIYGIHGSYGNDTQIPTRCDGFFS